MQQNVNKNYTTTNPKSSQEGRCFHVLVVSNKELNSVAVNENIVKTCPEWMSSEAGDSAILKQMALQELNCMVLSRKVYAEVIQEKEMLTSWNRLKSCRVTLNSIQNTKTIHWALCTQGSLTTRRSSKEIHCRITQAEPLFPSTKTSGGLNQNQRRKKGLPSLIQAMRI